MSRTVRDYVLRHYPDAVDASRITVIEPGIEASAFPRREEADRIREREKWAQLEPALGTQSPLLLLPGRGTRLKGHHDAIELVATLPDAVLWLLGAQDPQRKEYLDELRALAASKGVVERVVISAPTHEIASAMRASDVVLQLSRKPEAFGRTVIESLQSGVPVAGWSHGGAGELMEELYPAGGVEPFDMTKLSETVRRLLTQSASIPLPAHVPYTLQRMQASTLALYQELTQTPR